MVVKLRNATGTVSKIGYAVVIDSKDPNSFIYAPANATSILGIIKEAKPYREMCEITVSGEALVYVNGNVVKGNTIRTAKSNDKTSLGTCVIAKTSDSPYLKVGDALESGKGLIKCVLNFAYNGDPSGTGFVPYVGATGDVDLGIHSIVAATGHFNGEPAVALSGQGIYILYADFAGAGVITSYNNDTSAYKDLVIMAEDLDLIAHVFLDSSLSVGVTDVTDASYDVDEYNYYIRCDPAVDMVVNLPQATASGRVLKIKNVNITGKTVTITPLGAETVDGEATQVLYNGDCIELIDDDINGWSIT